MRTLIIEAEVSLDGVINSPEIWSEIFRYHSDDVTGYLHSLLLNADELIMGRKTYEFLLRYGLSVITKIPKELKNSPC